MCRPLFSWQLSTVLVFFDWLTWLFGDNIMRERGEDIFHNLGQS